MPSYLYVGSDERVFPGDGVTPTLHVSPGDHVEVDGELDPRYFDPVNGDGAPDTTTTTPTEQAQE
jgi:hypothetical protein